MYYINILVYFVSIFALTLSLSVEKHAEIVPSVNCSLDQHVDHPVILVNLKPSPKNPVFGDLDPISRLLNRIMKGPFPFPPTDPAMADITSSSTEHSGHDESSLPSFNFPSVRFPDLSSYPNNFDNSTHEVRVINGTKIEIHRIISKNKDQNGDFVQEVQIVRYSPDKDSGVTSQGHSINVVGVSSRAALHDSDSSHGDSHAPVGTSHVDPHAPSHSPSSSAHASSHNPTDTSYASTTSSPKLQNNQPRREKKFKDFGPSPHLKALEQTSESEKSASSRSLLAKTIALSSCLTFISVNLRY